jgi:hypothetical protein
MLWKSKIGKVYCLEYTYIQRCPLRYFAQVIVALVWSKVTVDNIGSQWPGGQGREEMTPTVAVVDGQSPRNQASWGRVVKPQKKKQSQLVLGVGDIIWGCP